VVLTATAVAKVKELLDREAHDGLRLRVSVAPGGCSGLRYQLFFDDRIFDGDRVTRFGDEPAAPGSEGGGHE